jgi:hypothetical protein
VDRNAKRQNNPENNEDNGAAACGTVAGGSHIQASPATITALENREANLKTQDGIDANFLAQEKLTVSSSVNTTAKSTAVVTDEEIDLKEAEQEFQDGSGDNGSQDDVDCIYEPMDDTLAGQEKVNLLGTEQEEGVNSESLGTKIQNIKDAKPVSTKRKPRKLTPKLIDSVAGLQQG